jgi:multidrug efflux pump subunit AcrB
MNGVPESVVDTVAIALIVTWLLQVAVAVIFVPHLLSEFMETRERAGGALRDLFVSGVIALTAANYLFAWALSPSLLFILIVVAYLTFPLRSAIFLYLWARGRFM